MKKLGLIISLILICGLAFANAYNVSYNETSMGYELNFELGDFNVIEKEFNGGTFATIDFEGSIVTTEKGFAELPYLSTSIQIENRNLDVQVIPGTYEEFVLNYHLLPSRGSITRDQDPATIPYVVTDESIINEFYPGDLAVTSEPYILRDVRGINIYANPFQYNAATKTLRVYKSLQIVLTGNMEIPTNALPVSVSNVVPTMNNMYSSLFINYDRDRFDHEMGDMGSILVIRTARDADVMIPYIQWKRERGFTVYEEVVATGTNVTSFIQEKYDEHNDILYVQLVGDWADVKSNTNGVVSGAPMDPMMGCVVGTDNYPDIIVGRFSASNVNHVTIQVNKTINYEKNPDPEGTWYSSLMGVGSTQGSSNGDDNEPDYVHLNVIKNDKLLPFTYTDYSDVYDPSANTSMVATAVNNGISIANYCGHGSHSSWVTSGFSNSHVNQLTNGDMLPVILSVACVNGEFHTGSDCFAEAWLRKENGGAVGFWGGTINQPWAPPMRGQDYANDMLIGGYDYAAHAGQNGTSTDVQKTTFGSACMNGAVLMYSEANSSEDLKTLQTWTIFGDASLQIRTDTPAEISLSNETVLMGIDFVTTVTADGIPAEGANVTLSQGSEAFTGITDASGTVTIPNNLEAGFCTMTVTGFNLDTIYDDEVTVIPPDGAYVLLQETSYYDDNNNIAEYNESGSLGVTLNNVGSETAISVELALSTENTYVTITDATSSAGDINADESVVITDAFQIQLANNVPDQESILFLLEMTGQATWESNLSLIVNAPSFELGNMIINDAAGNNNGMLDAGEVATISIPVSNIGHAVSQEISALLSSANPEILVVNTASVSLDELAVGGTAVAAFDVTVADDAPVGSIATLGFSLTSGAYTATGSFAPSIGLVFEDFETGDFSKFEWNNGTPGWEIDTDAQEGSYSAKSADINDNQIATLSITMDISADGEISFWKKVSSENNYDFLKFYINGTEIESWSGTVAWSEEIHDVSAGETTFMWKYTKDLSVSDDADCAWIDYIIFPGGGGAAGNPIATVSTNEINFDDVMIDETATEQFTISNIGSAILEGTITAPTGFTVSEDSYTVAAGASVTIDVVFAPTELIEYTGNVVVTTNDPNNAEINIVVSGTGTDGSNGDNPEIPAVTTLQGNYPNPFNPTTTIKFGLKEESNVKLEIYNIRGQKVRTLINERQSAGYHTVSWEGTDNNSNKTASGIYFYRLTTDRYTSTKKMILMK